MDLYLSAICEHDEKALAQAWHTSGLRLGLTSDGIVCKQNASTILETFKDAVDGRIIALAWISDSCACAKIRVIDESTAMTEFATMLKDESWKIIASVQSSASLGAHERKIVPSDFTQVTDAVWEGYVAAGRSGDSFAMGKVFHPDCNLTEATSGTVSIVNSDAFCHLVVARWSMEAHVPYAHLKDDARISAADTLLSVDFAGPDVAMVTLKIGYPPFLYTDVLLLLRLALPVAERPDSKAGWWIVAKSSDHEPWMDNEARPGL